jgi:hypothetical protein
MGGRLQYSFNRGQVFFVFIFVTVSLLSSLGSAGRTKAIIPLYVDIEDNFNAWDPLFKAYAITELLPTVPRN